MNKYYFYNIKNAIKIKNLITIEYLDISKDFNYLEEEHNFYELVYVDSGKITCNLNNTPLTLVQHDFLLIQPHTIHNYTADKFTKNSSIFIICFSSSSQVLSLLNKVIHFNNEEINIISTIFNESKNTFVFPFNRKIELIKNPLFGAQQVVEQSLEILLIKLLRNNINASKDSIKIIIHDEKINNTVVDNIIKQLQANIYNKITLDDISTSTFYTKTYINRIFKKIMGKSIMQYYNFLKIEEAKNLLKEKHSIYEVSNMLCFDNPNYFSKVFYKYTNKTPSQYKNSITSIVE